MSKGKIVYEVWADDCDGYGWYRMGEYATYEYKSEAYDFIRRLEMAQVHDQIEFGYYEPTEYKIVERRA